MKIVVIASYAPSLINFRGPLLATLAQNGHEVLACAPEEDQNLIAALTEIGVNYRSIKLSRIGLNPIRDLNTIIDIYKILKDFKPDIVLGYTIKPVIYGSIAARLAGIRQCYSIITGLGYLFAASSEIQKYDKRQILKKLVCWMYRLSLSFNTAVMFQNPDDRALFIRLKLISQAKGVVINGSGVDLYHFSEVPVKARSKPSFLLIARLLKEKGILEYVAAASVLKSKYPETTFGLVGPLDRNDASSLTASQVTEWDQKGLIKYFGVAEDVRPFLADADVFVLPSFYGEGTPRTILEAMSSGRPIITTDTPGCRETVIDGWNGYLVPVRDVPALIEAMEKFVGHPELIKSMGKRSREIAEQKYDVHKVNLIIMQTLGLYNSNN